MVTKEKEIIDTLEDMAEVGDAVFLHPILDGYKRYRDSHIGHYFLSSLRHIKSEDTGKHLNDLLEQGEMRNNHIIWVLDVMSHLEYYPTQTSKIAETCLENYSNPEFKKSLMLDEIALGFILQYLKKSGLIEEHKENIRNLLFEESLDRREKSTALSYLLRIDPSGEIEYLIENYPSRIKNSELELIITKELLVWQGGTVDKLKNLIIENGQERAKEILKKEQAEKLQAEAKAEKVTQQKESVIYSNSRMVREIVSVRRDINRKAQSSPNFQYRLFPDNELLLTQIESTNDESSFIDSCVKLRSVIQKIDDKVRNHGLNETTVKSLLPDAKDSDIEKSLNQLFLYLKSKNIEVDSELFGLRLLNRVLSLTGHPEAEKYLTKSLSKINAIEMYNEKEWNKLHKYLLSFYKRALEKLDEAFKGN